MKTVAVIGAGPAGLISAYFSAINGNNVILFEKNEKLGKKLYITGKGRCNLSNDVLPMEFLENVVSNSKFLTGVIYSFSPQKTMEFFENNGLKLKVERGNRVFPESDRASDVTKTLERLLRIQNVEIRLNSTVKSIISENGKAIGIQVDDKILNFDSIICATGGVSYPLTGSTGDGFKFAKDLGHTIKNLRPALVGIELKGNFFKALQGISLKNVSLSALVDNKVIYSEMGEMLFTHFGISGPIVLSCSSVINRYNFNDIELILDLKPALDVKTLDLRLQRELQAHKLRSVINIMPTLLPKNMATVVLNKAGVNSEKICSEITKEERFRINQTLKNFVMEIKSLRPIEEAIVTSGGVSVKEINPKTMESKLIKGLFFAGEVIDVDAFTGGFNIQIAFSTGKIAGENA